jgi:hypothetical protein
MRIFSPAVQTLSAPLNNTLVQHRRKISSPAVQTTVSPIVRNTCIKEEDKIHPCCTDTASPSEQTLTQQRRIIFSPALQTAVNPYWTKNLHNKEDNIQPCKIDNIQPYWTKHLHEQGRRGIFSPAVPTPSTLLFRHLSALQNKILAQTGEENMQPCNTGTCQPTDQNTCTSRGGEYSALLYRRLPALLNQTLAQQRNRIFSPTTQWDESGTRGLREGR